MELKARDVIKMSRTEVLNLPKVDCTIHFDSSSHKTTVKNVILNWFLWGTYNTYPDRPLEIRHWVDQSELHSGKIREVQKNMQRDLYKSYGPGGFDPELVAEITYAIMNDISNFVSLNLEAWVVGTTVEDYDEIYYDPEFRKMKEAMKPTSESIDSTINQFRDMVYGGKWLPHNQLVRNMQLRTNKLESVMQNILSRGYISEINSEVYDKPVLPSFYEGVTTLSDSMKESRSSSKASVFQTKPLQDSQYFKRRMELLGGVLIDIHYGDCGSTTGIDVEMTEERIKGYDGRYYFKDGNSKQWIDLTDPNSYQPLIGQTVKIRSPLECKHRGNGGTCSICLGAIAENIPKKSAVGIVSVIVVCGPLSQLMLSVKHDDRSSAVINFQPRLEDQQFILRGMDDNEIRIVEPTSKKSKVLLKLPVAIKDKGLSGAKGLVDLKLRTELTTVQANRLTEFETVAMEIREPSRKVIYTDSIKVSTGERTSSLTPEMCHYISEYGYELVGDTMTVDMQHWDYNDPVFRIPRRHLNTMDFVSSVVDFIESKGKLSDSKIKDYKDPNIAVRDFYDMINSKIRINSHHLELILLTLTKSAIRDNDWGIAPYGEPIEFVDYNTLLNQRSLSALMGYERQRSRFIAESTYRSYNRPRHILDPILCP